ncbi:MAG: NUDIX hydrolase [Syntrophomonadaceae bacterium]|nr:NUDIX hydrolase [Syntrophomonadaceae bacterium]
MDLTEKTISSQPIFSGRIIDVQVDTVLLPNGKQSTREIVKHAEAVAIVAVDDENYIYLVKQYRKPVEQVLLEVPAGILEPNEDITACAHRELAEETGLRAGQMEKIFSFYTAPGFTDEKIHIFLASSLSEGETNLDVDEFVETVRIPLIEAYKMIITGEIVDAKSIIGIQYLYNEIVKKDK